MARSVLIVDDNKDLRENVAEILEAEGFHVEGAGDADQALARLDRAPPPDVVLLDLRLPGSTDGRGVAAAIRANPRLAGVRVVVVTGLPPGPGARRAIPADAFLAKPFGIAQLFAAIRAVAGAA